MLQTSLQDASHASFVTGCWLISALAFRPLWRTTFHPGCTSSLGETMGVRYEDEFMGPIPSRPRWFAKVATGSK